VITALIQNINNPVFNWSNGQTGSTITVYNNDTLFLSVVNPISCCIILDTIVPNLVVSNLSVQLPNDTTFCFDPSSPFFLIPDIVNSSGNLTFEWNNQSQNDSILVNQSGTYWVNVSNSCNSTSDTIDVIINQTPIFTGLIFDTICNQNSTSIFLTSDINASYTWNAIDNPFVTGESLITSNSDSISDLLTNNSNSIQNVIYNVNSNVGNCASIQNITVTIVPTIIAPIITSNGPTSFCSGGSVQLTSNYQSGNIWSTGDTTQLIIVSSSDTITLFNQINQCFSPFTNIIITENTASIPTASISGGGIFCDGDTIDPVVVNFTGNGPWTIDFEINGITQTPIVSSNATLNLGQIPGNYQITNFFDINCSNIVVDSALIIINPTPLVTVSPISICEGSSGILTAIPNIIGGTYFWPPNGETTSSINVAPQFTTSYSVIYTLNNCPSESILGNVVVNSIPIVSIYADTLSGCVPQTVNFTSTSLSDPNACIWTLSNGITLNGCNPSYTFTQPGCYDVTLSTTLNACSGSSTLNNLICINGFPEALFTANPLVINLDNSTVNFENLSINASSYEWEFGDGSISSLTNPSHNFAINEEGYMIVLTAYSEFGCFSTDTLIINYEEDLIFYVPNAFTPDGDQFNQVFKPVFTAGFDPSSYNLTIIDRWGEILFESNDVNVGWDGTYAQSPNIVQDGIYVWKISFKLKKNDERKVYTGHVNVLK
jgi:gliding motility-associated-like protein